MLKKTGTQMSSFGVSKRVNHDSTPFYSRALYHNTDFRDKDIDYTESSVSEDIVDKIFCQDSRDMYQLSDNSVHLMITSPPYNVGKDYDENLSMKEYLKLLKDVFTEIYRVLVPGGRACVNIANLGRKPYIPLHSFIISDMLEIGYLMRGEIIWDKSASAGTSTAWGSWQSASNPTLRDVHEYILIFSKGDYKRDKKNKKDTITKDEFMKYTKSVWQFPAESAKKVKHPAPFPTELPSRLIKLYSFQDDVILDPFCGSGSTCLSASKLERHYIGYDNNKEYCKIAQERIKIEFAQFEFLLHEKPSSQYKYEKKRTKNKK